MDQNLKERLVGASVLIILAVIFIPMFLSDVPITDDRITGTNIPEKPETFSSRIVPLESDGDNTAAVADTVPQSADTESVAAPVEKPEPDVDTSSGESEPEAAGPVVREVKKDPGGVGLTAWVVQLGSFSSEANAQSLNQELRKNQFPSFVEPLVRENNVIYRVRVGPELRRSSAEELKKRISKTMGVEGILVEYP